MTEKYIIGVVAIVLDQHKRILLVHRCDMDFWDLPGGGMEPGELPTEAAIRETKEETGLDVRVEKLLAVGVTPENVVGFCFYCHVTGGAMATSDESDDVRFFDTDGLPENLLPRKRAIIRLALEYPQEIVFLRVDLPRV